jgi:hypothetical protein
MKTEHEIQHALALCTSSDTPFCADCAYKDSKDCKQELDSDSRALIEQLIEERNERNRRSGNENS